MIRIIVAEDEYFARKVLLKMLKELNLDLEICGEAETGTEIPISGASKGTNAQRCPECRAISVKIPYLTWTILMI